MNGPTLRNHQSLLCRKLGMSQQSHQARGHGIRNISVLGDNGVASYIDDFHLSYEGLNMDLSIFIPIVTKSSKHLGT